MTPHYSDPLVTLYLGDCLDVMRELPDASVDSVVTDPPYGLGFMGKAWDSPAGQASWTNAGGALGIDHKLTTDRSGSMKAGKYDLSIGSNRAYQAWCTEWATEAFRVLKPGGYLLAFGGTRTYHRLASAIEDAGFEIRDTLMWIYASGFPKSLDVSKALDKVAGAEREVTGTNPNARPNSGRTGGIMGEARGAVFNTELTAPATELARKWEGWGTALKPAHEPIVMARKPLIGTVAANVTRCGTGALNIDGTRIGTDAGWSYPNGRGGSEPHHMQRGEKNGLADLPTEATGGRWPSNVLLSDPELFDEPNPGVVGSGATTTSGSRAGEYDGSDAWSGPFGPVGRDIEGDSGGYSRFFIIPKADRAERERGMNTAVDYEHSGPRGHTLNGDGTPRPPSKPRGNLHPTVKPIDLMRHLVRLVTPPGGVCLDPFLGSGTTALAASEEGFRCIGIEREAEYLEIAVGRLMATPMGLGLDVSITSSKKARPRETEGRDLSTANRQDELIWKSYQPDEEDAA